MKISISMSGPTCWFEMKLRTPRHTAHVRDQLKRLPADQRGVNARAFFGELTHVEIAALSISPPGP
jgi:DNA-directed RNA polymerase specialized sigma24 family protein